MMEPGDLYSSDEDIEYDDMIEEMDMDDLAEEMGFEEAIEGEEDQPEIVPGIVVEQPTHGKFFLSIRGKKKASKNSSWFKLHD